MVESRVLDTPENLRKVWSDYKAILKVPKIKREAVEDKVRELEAREQIRELLATYTYYWNSKDIDGILSIFSESGEIVHGLPYKGVYKGKDRLRRFFEDIVKKAPLKGLRVKGQEDKHHITNVVIRVDEDVKKAQATAYFFRVSTGEKQGMNVGMIATGWYVFELEKAGEDWKLRRLKIDRCFQSDEFKITYYL